MSPASLLLLFSSLTLVAAAISADEQGGGSCSPRTCGNVTISHPFGFVPEQETDTKCGRLGFEVHCSNNTPYLGYYRRKYRFQVLDIFYGNSSLLVADVHKLDDFRNSSSKGCHVMTANTSSKVGQPFSVSSANLNLIFYNCTAETAAAAVRRDGGLVETKCSGGGTLVRVGGHYSDSGSYEEYSVEGCGATLVPVLGTSSGEANASSYEELISDGFLLTWQPPSGFIGKTNADPTLQYIIDSVVKSQDVPFGALQNDGQLKYFGLGFMMVHPISASSTIRRDFPSRSPLTTRFPTVQMSRFLCSFLI
ncbi:hypothetical protein [Oryza sativa Japonica Group]|uniref:Uncharacterized protein P0443D08.18 n=1 Tax=Oryza sativa subsp. japonica TaxID=39947 RepID=Q5ZC59_ORYSJ|nr:hypothetical protein [Oryza sativa Japonica Group]